MPAQGDDRDAIADGAGEREAEAVTDGHGAAAGDDATADRGTAEGGPVTSGGDAPDGDDPADLGGREEGGDGARGDEGASVVTPGGAAPDGGEVLASVRVPASSANLGPGFDVLAVAIDLPLVVEARPFDGRRVVATGEGADEVPDDDGNLVWRGVRAFCDVYGAEAPDVTLHCDNAIPLARGLGSSSAAAVAGLVMARALTGIAVADQDVIDLATQMEGHADNAAAAVLGGLVVAGPTGRARRFDPSRGLRPLVCIPTQRSSTKESRGLLPAEVTLEVMVATARRTALVLAGLAGVAAWDPATMVDDVHEPPRLQAMARSQALITAAREAGYGACLSGAGPTVLVLAAPDDETVGALLVEAGGDGWRIEQLHWDRAGASVGQPAGTVS